MRIKKLGIDRLPPTVIYVDRIGYFEKHLRPKEVCEILGITRRTLFNWNKKGKIFCFRTLGNHRRIPIQEVNRILTFNRSKELRV